jgi:predicted esterase
MYPLDSHPQEYRQHIQLAGLKESVEYVHALLRDAVREVGAGNVVVMGLSQGCAVGLVALLLWDGGRLGAFVGMCGWLPLRREMVDAVGGDESQEEGEEDGGGLFERDEMEVLKDGGKSKLEHAIEWLGGELERSRDATQRCNGAELEKTPVFLGHGHEDEKVPLQLGSLASDCLKELGFDVRWREYPGLAHWYSSDMLHDIVVFLNERKGNSQ